MQSGNPSGRSLVVFILAFATLVDLICPLLTRHHGFLGIGKSFFVLGMLFILQYNSRVVRIVLLSLFFLVTSFWIVQLLANPYHGLLANRLFPPSVVPLYISLAMISISSWVFLRRYDISRTR